ncbi:MAG: FAD-dependent oxidoreductase [Rhodocyclaceae bacterium]|nr:FAD-dependent oxidoreductase [Rhodocyclaceae bacterium]
MINITLNGLSVEVSADLTIREVAESHGIHIPTFCHDNRLKPFASCFLCVVEVEKARTLLPACSTRVASGMVIHTDSERVIKSRKIGLDLILSDHAGDCIAPCEAICPANIDIQGYIAHIANGQFEAAVRLIKERNPLPVVCGRICPHPCESECRRTLVDGEAVAINPLKRFSSEYELANGPFVIPAGAETGKRVAIVGGGPAGLSAASFLRRMGHAVEIFEALPHLGGMARYGIPRFRLPWELMDREIQSILDMGVTVHHNQRLGTDFTIASLKEQGFGAVLLAIGAHKAKPMRIANETVPGVIGGVDFLRQVVLGEITEIGRRVAVIGGGDTAMDCARVARRLGNKGAEVTLLYRRSQAEMPALPAEQHETIEEGVEIRFLTAPLEVVLDDAGHARALKVITMALGEPDASGRRSPVPVAGSEEDLPFDLIIAAIGQDPDMSCLAQETSKPDVTKWSTFIHDAKTHVTSMEGVFAAGDCAFGPDILIRAIGEGRRAALAIDLHLNGAQIKLQEEYAISRGWLAELEAADYSPRFIHKKRALETTFPPDARLKADGWGEINRGLDEAQAMAESTRCIECGCNARFDCDLRDYATEYGATEKRLAGAHRKCAEDTRHPFIRIEADKCITCGACVRICSEVREINALAFVHRGFSTRIGPNFGDGLAQTGCDACGMCIDVCPTGAMSANTGKETGPWISVPIISTCTACSRGCALTIHTAGNRVVKVTSVADDPVNGACICAEGRFSYQLFNGQAIPNQTAAIAKARSLIATAQAIVVSPWLPVEDLYAAVCLSRELKSEIVYLATSITPALTPLSPCGRGAGGEGGGGVANNGKLIGEVNAALLHRLGVKPVSILPKVDCLIAVGAFITSEQVEGAQVISSVISSVISIGRYDIGIPSTVQIIAADPLETRGVFLNGEGDLGIMRSEAIHQNHKNAMRDVLTTLSTEGHRDLATLRNALANEVPELAVLNRLPLLLPNGRLVKIALPVEIVTAAQDARHVAFEK